jgi:hypothetical protein
VAANDPDYFFLDSIVFHPTISYTYSYNNNNNNNNFSLGRSSRLGAAGRVRRTFRTSTRVCEAVNTAEQRVYIYSCILFYVYYIYLEEINDPNRVPI